MVDHRWLKIIFNSLEKARLLKSAALIIKRIQRKRNIMTNHLNTIYGRGELQFYPRRNLQALQGEGFGPPS